MNYGCRTKWSGPSEQRSSRLIAELWRCGLCVLQLPITAGDIWRYDHHRAAGGQQPGQHVASLAFCQYVSILGGSGEWSSRHHEASQRWKGTIKMLIWKYYKYRFFCDLKNFFLIIIFLSILERASPKRRSACICISAERPADDWFV